MATLTPEGARVIVVNTQQDVATCAARGFVEQHGDHPADVMVDLRNKAAELGATHVLITSGGREPYNSYAVAKAYQCDDERGGTQAVEIIANERGCSKDTDCKGDRICSRGACVDP